MECYSQGLFRVPVGMGKLALVSSDCCEQQEPKDMHWRLCGLEDIAAIAVGD